MVARITGVVLAAVTLAVPVAAQEHQNPPPVDADGQGAKREMRMVMPTNDAKVFRLIRPVVAALQVRLADAGVYSGRINGLYGPSTREALAAYQRSSGRDRTGLATLWDALALAGLEPGAAIATYTVRIAMDPHDGMSLMPSAAMPMAAAQDAVMQHGHSGSDPAPVATVGGDPAPPKSLMLMPMPGMRMRETDHTRAVRAVRAVVAALQIRLAESGHYGGQVDGLPATAATVEAIRRYQEEVGLANTGRLDFATALALFGLDPEAARARYADRLALDQSPVALHDSLMQASMNRQRKP